jgi:hypothetical protein
MDTAAKYIGHFLAACLDFAAGVFIVATLSAVLQVDVPLWVYPLSAFLAVLPDTDIFLPVLRASDLLGWDHHQTFMHRPLLILPAVTLLGTVIGFLLGNLLFYALVFFSCVFWHYVHDTKGMVPEGGIAWAWPFSRYYLSPFGKDVPEQVRHRETPFYLEWIHPTVLSVRELFFAVLFLTFAPVFDQNLIVWATYLVPLFGVSILCVWILFSKRKTAP